MDYYGSDASGASYAKKLIGIIRPNRVYETTSQPRQDSSLECHYFEKP